jgi:HAD superfamily hydrolase (TIGR01509 family)
MLYKGIIFDFNGVLWWDTEIQEQVWKDFASEVANRQVTEAELKEHMHGRPNKYFLEYLTQRELTSNEVKELGEQKESKYRETCLNMGNAFKLSPGAVELLDYLKNHKIPRTIATASEIKNITFFFQNLSLDRWFDFDRVVFDDGIIRGKPYPDKYLKAAENIQLNPKDCIVIEDSSSGIKAAYAAGIGRILGLGNTADRQENLLKLKEVDDVIDSLIDFRVDIFNLTNPT